MPTWVCPKPNCRHTWTTESRQVPQSCPKCGEPFQRQQDILREAGAIDKLTEETVREIREHSPLFLREGSEAPVKKVGKYWEVMALTDKAGLVKVVPFPIETDVPRIPGYALEALETPEEKAQIERSKEIVEGVEALFGLPSSARCTFTICSTQQRITELRAKAARMSAQQLREAVGQTEGLLQEMEEAEQQTRSHRQNSQEKMYGFPDNPDQRKKIASEVGEMMEGATLAFAKIKKAIPHLKEIKGVYEQCLASAEKTEAEEREKLPNVMNEMAKLSKEAQKLLPKITRLASEYQETQRENILGRLAVLVENYGKLQSQWMDHKREVANISPTPEFPPMADLPALPFKVWKLIEQGGEELWR